MRGANRNLNPVVEEKVAGQTKRCSVCADMPRVR